MTSSLMIFQAIISILLILVVLLQFGKGAEAGLLGGGASEAVFSGSQKGNILSKITAVLAVLFLANSILLSKVQSSKTGSSLMDDEAPVSRRLNSDAPVKAKVPTDKKAAPAAPVKTETK